MNHSKPAAERKTTNKMTARTKACDIKLKKCNKRVSEILKKIKDLRLSNSFISQLDVPKSGLFNGWKNYKVLVTVVLCLMIVIGTIYVYYHYASSRNCILEMPPGMKSIFRPPQDCSKCAGVHGLVRLSNITAQEFEEKYAYGATPVIVTDATKDWKAITHFNFKFFSDFYENKKLGIQVNDCFFFPYKSGFHSLEEVFTMDEARANLTKEPWYVGWSTCRDQETRELRTYYTRPYFLPKNAESDTVDWIFMGGPGQGADMHVDSVRHMSWQAQARGHKNWLLAPPSECQFTCNWIDFTVAPSEILVVDTNYWFHQTKVLPGDISITIGAEYD